MIRFYHAVPHLHLRIKISGLQPCSPNFEHDFLCSQSRSVNPLLALETFAAALLVLLHAAPHGFVVSGQGRPKLVRVLLAMISKRSSICLLALISLGSRSRLPRGAFHQAPAFCETKS